MAEVAEKPEVKKPKMYKIIFNSGENGTEKEDVVIGWNGKLNQYKRNVEALIDENFLSVLKDAVIHTHVQDEDGKQIAVTIPRFSYSVTQV